MGHYLVSAVPRCGRMGDLEARLSADAFVPLLPFGQALSLSLRNARRRLDGVVIWEEEGSSRPPLSDERAAVLDRYFDELQVEQVERGEGWQRIAGLPELFPALAGRN